MQVLFADLYTPYIPIPEGRGFTALFGKTPANVAGKIFRAEKLKITRKNEPTPSLESAFRAKGVTFLLTCVQISQNHYFVQFRSAGSWGRGVKTAQKLDF